MYTINGKSDKNYLLTQHATLVKRLAYHLKARLPPSVEVDDLVQAGMIGLLDAINRYEESHGAQFETFAVQRIRGAMLDELRSTDWLPRSIRQNMRKIEVAMTALQQRLGHEPSESELAGELKLSLPDYQALLNSGAGHQLLYYEDFHDAEDNEHFLDHHARNESGDPLKILLESGFSGAVMQAIDALPEREKILMGLYYEEDMNLKEIGAVMGVSESRVCQLHSQAVARLRSTLRGSAWTGEA
ncbi:RNA polymerase sigma factor FliA [Sulfuriferula sp.]|uniref:RNA polymerase sigma factor FliA n=1 Tax=Sulfuriferula sp. TaxID=2025307 RepID=UPI00272FC516|nr:RNA polymerase sigma factor FliA [Sulfuriferula sp.]MDP2025136.1 RNA polymerase sigma factor FliA [Sulfuriferula sp.]